jgi:hypothetical protein
MIAERENVKVNSERESRLLIVTKARVFSSEGWKVVVTDGEVVPARRVREAARRVRRVRREDSMFQPAIRCRRPA